MTGASKKEQSTIRWEFIGVLRVRCNGIGGGKLAFAGKKNRMKPIGMDAVSPPTKTMCPLMSHERMIVRGLWIAAQRGPIVSTGVV